MDSKKIILAANKNVSIPLNSTFFENLHRKGKNAVGWEELFTP